AQRQLRRALTAGAAAGAGTADLVTSAAGPLRTPFVYPPETFDEVDEVDLQAQMEAFPMWLHTAFSVDYYPRPGKASTLHEENWNDNGTGDQLLGQALLSLMRGSATSGHSALVPTTRQHDQLPDARSLVHGTASMHRVLAELLHEYGDWISRSRSADRVAILLSRRQFATETWYREMPNHFARIYEAYVALLYAQIPASLVFVEDLQLPGTRQLSDYAAVLLVHERIECEPAVLSALAGARRVFHDGACTSIVTDAVGSTPLNVTFDLADDNSFKQFNADSCVQTTNPNRAGATRPDAKSWRSISLAHVPALRTALADVVGADRATADDSEILVSERTWGDARLVIAVNSSVFDVDNALFRRAENHHTVRPPVATTLNLPSLPGTAAVYDVLAATRVTPSPQGKVPADFRHWPVSVHAILTAPISQVVVAAAPVVSAGAGDPLLISWSVRVLGGPPGTAELVLPVRVRILDAGNTVLWENRTITPAVGGFVVPANAQGAIRVEAVELVSGRPGVADAQAQAGGTPIDLLPGSGGDGGGPVTSIAAEPGTGAATVPGTSAAAVPGTSAAAAAAATNAPASVPEKALARPMAAVATPWQAAAKRLGAHLREIALTGDGGAVLTAANWDTNLYAIDLATGQQRWQTRIGQQYAYDPQPAGDAIAVRGMALDTPSGFGLHLVNTATGAVEHRFDLHGTTPRWFLRITSVVPDGRPPAFAAAPSGAWVTTAGNLGLAVWRREDSGFAELWHQDWWSRAPLSDRPGASAEVVLTALGEDTVLVAGRGLATAYQVSTGATRWQTDLTAVATAFGGLFTGATPSPDGMTVALASTYDSGRVFLLRTADGSVAAALNSRADELAWGPDSRSLVTLRDTRLDQFGDTGSGWALRRSYPAADVLHNLDIAADGRIACGDEQGNLIVLDANAEPVLVTDVTGIPAVRWLPGGDLLFATWLGRVGRLNGTTYQQSWSTQLRSAAPDMRAALLAAETAPVSRIAVAGNGTTPAVAGLPNLLTATTTIAFVGSSLPGGTTPLSTVNLLNPAHVPPQAPLLSDDLVEYTAEGFPLSHLLVQSHLSSPPTFDRISLWDDPAHPESWLRDVRLDARTTSDSPWQPVARLVCSAAARTYQVPRTTATDIRLVVPPGLPGNLRLAGIALHAPS
ncbi:WD40 repeat domain-containing protein, partial [Streptomyces sp. NPDC060223]|uniref:WD40 repeat domain-containing protein n=3 Tax=unclassified Streptomyces TaxID=2593676 RepID=UPI0036562055